MCLDQGEPLMTLPPGRKPLGNDWFVKQLLPKVTRVEVIDSNGRVYTQYDARDVSISFQDDARTLKIFLRND